MDKNLTAEIFVPTREGNGQHGKVGTGYPIGKGLVLTARHVLMPDDRDDEYPIEIRWKHPGLAADEQGWHPVDEVVWGMDTPEIDVAIVRTGFPRVIDSWGLTTRHKPVTHQKWESEGFAAAGGKDEDGRRRPVALGGDVFSAGDQDPTFDVQVMAPTDDLLKWQGASGSPVFIGRRILGVVCTCPDNFQGARFKATPVWKLLEIQSFRDVLGYDDQLDKVRQVTSRVARLLERTIEGMESLDKECFRSDDEPVAESTEQRATRLADRLLMLDIESLVIACRRAQRSLLESGDTAAAALISKMLCELLPVRYEFDATSSIRTGELEAGSGFISLPISTRTVAELIMADVDLRRACYRFENDRAVGENSLPMAPESGCDESGEAFIRSMETHLFNVFGRPENSNQKRSNEERRKMVVVELESDVKSEQRTHYYLFHLPVDEGEQVRVKQSIQELKRRYPPIKFLCLDDSFDTELHERKLVRPLEQILSAESSTE